MVQGNILLTLWLVLAWGLSIYRANIYLVANWRRRLIREEGLIENLLNTKMSKIFFFWGGWLGQDKGEEGCSYHTPSLRRKKGYLFCLKCQFLAKGCDSIEIEEKFWIKIRNCWTKWVFVFNCFKIFNAITNQLYFNILLGLKPEEEFFFSR